MRVVAPAANDADFQAGEQDRTVLRFSDLHIAPTPLFFAMLACAMPLLMLGAAVESLASITVGAVLLIAALGCLFYGIQTLRGLQLRCGSPPPCFAGDTAMVELHVMNPAGATCWDIAVTLGSETVPGASGWIEVAPRSRRRVLMPIVATGQGRQGLPPVRLQTQHPFGLVCVSAWWVPRRDLVVLQRPLLDGIPSTRFGE